VDSKFSGRISSKELAKAFADSGVDFGKGELALHLKSLQDSGGSEVLSPLWQELSKAAFGLVGRIVVAILVARLDKTSQRLKDLEGKLATLEAKAIRAEQRRLASAIEKLGLTQSLNPATPQELLFYSGLLTEARLSLEQSLEFFVDPEHAKFLPRGWVDSDLLLSIGLCAALTPGGERYGGLVIAPLMKDWVQQAQRQREEAQDLLSEAEQLRRNAGRPENQTTRRAQETRTRTKKARTMIIRGEIYEGEETVETYFVTVDHPPAAEGMLLEADQKEAAAQRSSAEAESYEGQVAFFNLLTKSAPP